MRRALLLAARATGRTSPNPLVGATVVSPDGVIAGDGWHHAAGMPHAEVHALDAAGARARGATLYCTLEPCCHTGRTGPCVARVHAAGISRVVVAVEDANPLVAGKGVAWLRARGVAVDVGVGRDEALSLNAPFFRWVTSRRPFVIFKAGLSLDGYLAERPGVRTAITSEESWRQVHRLRAEVDAVAVGSGTVLTDDPLLTVRGVWRDRPLARVVFDRRLRTPPSARLLTTAAAGPVLVITTMKAVDDQPERARALAGAGAEVLTPEGGLAGALAALAARGVVSLLLEGGAGLAAAFWDAGMIDRVRLHVAPRPLGPGGLRLLEGRAFSMASLSGLRVEPCGPDVLLMGDVHGSG